MAGWQHVGQQAHDYAGLQHSWTCQLAGWQCNNWCHHWPSIFHSMLLAERLVSHSWPKGQNWLQTCKGMEGGEKSGWGKEKCGRTERGEDGKGTEEEQRKIGGSGSRQGEGQGTEGSWNQRKRQKLAEYHGTCGETKLNPICGSEVPRRTRGRTRNRKPETRGHLIWRTAGLHRSPQQVASFWSLQHPWQSRSIPCQDLVVTQQMA